jgi:hypothetical protein
VAAALSFWARVETELRVLAGLSSARFRRVFEAPEDFAIRLASTGRTNGGLLLFTLITNSPKSNPPVTRRFVEEFESK